MSVIAPQMTLLLQMFYILLFTGVSSYTAQLELVHDMKSVAFIRAFTRFIARLGQSKLIVNDKFHTFESKDVNKYLAN